MGWHPDMVRPLSLSDFAAAFEGWKMANGINDGPRLTDREYDEIRQMLDEDEG